MLKKNTAFTIQLKKEPQLKYSVLILTLQQTIHKKSILAIYSRGHMHNTYTFYPACPCKAVSICTAKHSLTHRINGLRERMVECMGCSWICVLNQNPQINTKARYSS